MGDCPFFRVFIGGCGASYLGVSAGGGNCLFITSAISLEEMPLHCSLTGYMVSLVVFSVKRSTSATNPTTPGQSSTYSG